MQSLIDQMEEMVGMMMLVCASLYKAALPTNAISTGFSDVEANYWADPYIRVASANKWIYGYSDGSFAPANNIKLEEAATMLLRVLGYTSETGPCVLKYSGQNLVAIQPLVELKSVSLITSFGMVDNNKLHLYSDYLTVYTPANSKRSGLNYSTIPLSELLENIDDYNIEAYVDFTAKFGGRIRLIIAKPI